MPMPQAAVAVAASQSTSAREMFNEDTGGRMDFGDDEFWGWDDEFWGEILNFWGEILNFGWDDEFGVR